MPRTARVAPGGMVYHVINRGVGKNTLFFCDDDYLARFKSFPVETDDYFYQINRFAERNALRAKLVRRAEDWPWGSGWISKYGTAEHRAMISDWPLPRPRKWLQYVNEPATTAELAALRKSCVRGTPYGSKDWVESTARQLGLEATLRPPGRPKKL